VRRIRCSVSEPELGKADRINRRADPSCSGSPAVNLRQEIPRSRRSDCQRSSIITQIIYLRLGYLM
jgi:hypothetical protein